MVLVFVPPFYTRSQRDWIAKKAPAVPISLQVRSERPLRRSSARRNSKAGDSQAVRLGREVTTELFATRIIIGKGVALSSPLPLYCSSIYGWGRRGLGKREQETQ